MEDKKQFLDQYAEKLLSKIPEDVKNSSEIEKDLRRKVSEFEEDLNLVTSVLRNNLESFLSSKKRDDIFTKELDKYVKEELVRIENTIYSIFTSQLSNIGKDITNLEDSVRFQEREIDLLRSQVEFLMEKIFKKNEDY